MYSNARNARLPVHRMSKCCDRCTFQAIYDIAWALYSHQYATMRRSNRCWASSCWCCSKVSTTHTNLILASVALSVNTLSQLGSPLKLVSTSRAVFASVKHVATCIQAPTTTAAVVLEMLTTQRVSEPHSSRSVGASCACCKSCYVVVLLHDMYTL